MRALRVYFFRSRLFATRPSLLDANCTFGGRDHHLKKTNQTRKKLDMELLVGLFESAQKRLLNKGNCREAVFLSLPLVAQSGRSHSA